MVVVVDDAVVEDLLVILTTERSGLPYIYIDVTKVKVRHTGTGMLTSQ